MKILLVNWSWYPSGGDWTYVENVHKLYETKGYEVIPFSTHNKKNFSSPYSKYFVNTYDFKELNKNRNISNGIKALKTSVISQDAINKLSSLLDEHDIKIAHLNNIHHYITPAIVELLSKKGIKIIWTLHDYKIICPNNIFVSNGKVCEKCITGAFYNCAIHKCKKESFLASSLASFEAYYYHTKKTYSLVDYFLCPSQFLLEKFVHFGFSRSKLSLTNLCYDVSVIDDFISNKKNRGSDIAAKSNKYILYVGSLLEIKGVQTLIEAVKGSNITLKIAGSGTAEQLFKELAFNGGNSNIEFLGYKTKDEIFNLTMEAAFIVCPSICYENYPFSITESFLFSKPVIGSNIGGIPELVLDNKTGLLFEPGNVKDLKEKIVRLWGDDALVSELGKAARLHAYKLVNFSEHWQKLLLIIEQLKLSNV